jgi:hypothetical protein
LSLNRHNFQHILDEITACQVGDILGWFERKLRATCGAWESVSMFLSGPRRRSTYFPKHTLQKLWKQCKLRGSLNVSEQIEHVSKSSISATLSKDEAVAISTSSVKKLIDYTFYLALFHDFYYKK